MFNYLIILIIFKPTFAGEQFVIESDGLLVRNVRRSDAGTYTCRARVPQTGELEERDIRLDVQVNQMKTKLIDDL